MSELQFKVGMRLKLRHPDDRMQPRERFVVTQVGPVSVWVRQSIGFIGEQYLLAPARWLFMEVPADDTESGGFYFDTAHWVKKEKPNVGA